MSPSSAEFAPANRRERIGIFGGTFDPIHHGHLVAASEAAHFFGLQKIIFVPTGRSEGKTGTVDSEHRYQMSVIATAAHPLFAVSRVDIDRPGNTYTVDTLTDFRAKYPDADFFFIAGFDAMNGISSWKNSEKLGSLAHFIAVSRPGHSGTISGFPQDNVSYLEVPALNISSSECRERVGRNLPVWYLVPDGVVQYINKHHLYGSNE